ncbi:hypothetical protein AV530_007510 [Patagioenas fasciata monilis]|uniref:Uncharacterized protein n=1 Tax=Patagioenas fasciata monilis TaxID=372326 RepID=A0A1V4JY83_PATFA|nr:hypothetical protein AV530_007510 [Patagioenas fasciata monilis]
MRWGQEKRNVKSARGPEYISWQQDKREGLFVNNRKDPEESRGALNRLLQLRLRFWVLLRSTGSFYTWKCILSAYTAVRWSPETGEMDSRGKREVEKSTSNQPSKVVVLCHGADLGGLCGT